jgi:hypothetical protein
MSTSVGAIARNPMLKKTVRLRMTGGGVLETATASKPYCYRRAVFTRSS